MVRPFNIAHIPHLYFGNGKINALPELILKYGKTVLLLTGKASFRNQKAFPELMKALESNAVSCFDEVVDHEPSCGLIDDMVSKYGNKNIDVVVAIGGGSVVDAGKAISAMLLVKEPVETYLEGVGTRRPDGRKLPFIAVPTTAGTGSEATKNAVISKVGKKGFKKSLRHNNYVPDIALVDPELTLDCPPDITANSGMDAFTQLLESYVSTNANIFTDVLALEGLACIKLGLPGAYADCVDIEFRSYLSYAAYLSGITLANAGLGTIHGFAAAIGGYFDIPHGIVCGTLMGATNRLNVKRLKETRENENALKKYITVAKTFITKSGKDDEYYLDAFMDLIDTWLELMKVPRLGKYGIKPVDIDRIIHKTSNKNNPVYLEENELREIISERI